ncbi:Heat shock factor protein 2 [Arachnomyces sp. PD_36]|nr:Heat shock factor protein 2 [Arachnomyces sp. PD_36]
MEATQTQSTGSAGNSSDFVRKLYKMLEDPSYSQIVRWGDENNSFVVLECEKFTKSILPKHFKHSNFASFVRQLNKYDFHKVRQNNEENGQSPYGPNAWEFKHPEFRANSKGSLDNIRRKAPAPRKPAQLAEDCVPTQQMDLMNQQLVAQQQQIQQLSDRCAQLNNNHNVVLQEVSRVQKTVLSHQHVITQVMNFLHSVDARQRRDSRAGITFPAQGDAQGVTAISPTTAAPPVDDEPASPLQNASKLLNEMNNEMQFNLGSLDSISEMQRTNGTVCTPPLDQTQRNGALRPPTSAGSNSAPVNLETIVYPVGNTNGIDPMYSEHVNNIPYPLPPKEADSSDVRRQFVDNRKKSTLTDPGWIRSPQILLVEDDATCRHIGGKFLYSFSCVIDSAFDGLEAVNKIQEGSKYDLILMDIIMPNLDGVSACHLIRQFDRTPIIAMTSNIRSDDIQLYFQHGMDDVLPKPFTRKSLLDMLEKHLVHLKTIPPAIEAPPPSATAANIPQTSATQSVKDDSSPGQSPATSMNNWQSPGQFQGVSPIHTNVPNQYVPQQPPTPTTYTIDQNGVQYPPSQTPMNAATARQHRRQASEMSGTAEMNNFAKRPRVYAPNNPAVNTLQTSRPG